MYIHPMLETQAAIEDHIKDSEDKRKLLHVEALLKELLENIKEVTNG